MPEFLCRLAYPSGEIVERAYAAESEQALRRQLEAKDFLVLDIRQRSPLVRLLGELFRVKPRVSAKEFLFFNQELRALLRAGLPVLTALDILLERRKNPTFRRALVDVRDRVRAGEALSEAFAAQGDLFPRLYAAALASGERTGELPGVLDRFVRYQTVLMAIRRRVVQTLAYPAVLVAMSFGVVALLVFYVVPRFNEFLQDFGMELPLITKVLVNTAVFCTEHWTWLLLGVVGGVGGLLAWSRTAGGRIALDALKLRLPVVGGVIHDYTQNRFTRTLGTLVAGGIPVVQALEMTSRAVANAVFERALLQVANRVREGHALWESLEQTGLVSDIAVEMVKVGESAGALEEMLGHASDFTDEEIEYRLGRVITLFEPMVILFMAVVVGGMLLALYLPLLRAYSQARY